MQQYDAELLMSADNISLSIAPRVRGALALLERDPIHRDDEDLAAAMLVLQDVLRDIREAFG
jgi:hypothetical protein